MERAGPAEWNGQACLNGTGRLAQEHINTDYRVNYLYLSRIQQRNFNHVADITPTYRE